MQLHNDYYLKFKSSETFKRFLGLFPTSWLSKMVTSHQQNDILKSSTSNTFQLDQL